jgi:hypothetical protein
MFRVFRMLRLLFSGNSSMNTESLLPPADGELKPCPSGTLPGLSAKLNVASRLLIEPTPLAICELNLILEEIRAHLSPLIVEDMTKNLITDLKNLHVQLKRVRSLSEGAARVQWSQMRAVMALTQCYAPGGKTSEWHPCWPKVDVKV